MSVTIDSNQNFPVGASLTAYPASQWPVTQRPPGAQAPIGSATETATVGADGKTTFSSLADNTDYFIGRDIGGGVWRYVHLTTTVPSSPGVPDETITDQDLAVALRTLAYFNVKDPAYGARGDGATTDTTAIQAAITAASAAGGGYVFFPRGTYISGTLTLPSNVILLGAGLLVTIIKLKTGTNGDLIKTTSFDSLTGGATNGGVYGHGIRYLTLDGNKANNSSGRGLAAFGYAPVMDHFEIRNFKGIGLYHEWGDVSAVSSDTLATGMAEGKVGQFQVHRNEGGGIRWEGPADTKFEQGTVAKNGPASSSTTSGVEVGPNGTAAVFSAVHVWGTPHKYAWKLNGTQVFLDNCEGEGAASGQVWLHAGGCQIKGGRYFCGTSDNFPGIVVGEAAVVTVGECNIDTKLTNCGINFAADGGGHSIRLKVYWPDNTKTVITGTQHASTANRWNVNLYPGGAKLGMSIGDPHMVPQLLASNKDVKRWAPTQRPTGYKSVNQARAGAGTDLTGATTSGKLLVVGGLEVVKDEVITNVSFFSGATARVGTITHRIYGLWDSSLTFLAQTADDTVDAAWGDELEKLLALTAPLTVAADDVYYAGIMIAGTGLTWPSLAGSSVRGGISLKAPQLTCIPTVSGLTTLMPGNTITALSFAGGTATSKFAYVALS